MVADTTSDGGLFREPMPEPVASRVDERLEAGETVHIGIAADMLDEQTFGQQWLVVTDKRLLVMRPHVDGETREVLLTETREARTEDLVGGGRLEVAAWGAVPRWA